jgi:hypothetical protein
MKFDKSKILTVVTADQAKVGQKGWFAILPKHIQQNMSGSQPSVLGSIDLDSSSPFTMRSGYAWPLFYPAPEPTYAERQAEWVKENGVKEGTRIRITKDYGEDSDAHTLGHTGVAGRCGSVNCVGNSYINVNLDSEEFYLLTVPYYAMEVIKESKQTYEPITGFETGKWYVCHLTKRPHEWNIDGEMDGLLDGKPHKCTFGEGASAEFEDISSRGFGGWLFSGQLRYFEEVPSPVTSYRERQAEWVKENGVKEGTKVRFTKNFTNGEDGSWCCGHNDAKGMEGVVKYTGGDSLTVLVPYFGAWWAVPFTALEVIKEPTYEERQAEWVKQNNVKEGTKVRFTKGFEDSADGSDCCEHIDAKGMEGYIKRIKDAYLYVGVSYDSWAVPFTALEVIKEPTYTERQAEWVKENNVKEGTKVRVTRTFTKDEDGSYCCEHDDLVGMIGSVDKYGIVPHSLGIIMSDGYHRAIPYFALEVIKEPTYRPYNNDELNDLVGEVLTCKKSGRRKLVTGKPTEGSGVNLDGSYINAKNLLSSFYRNTNEPCGIKE